MKSMICVPALAQSTPLNHSIAFAPMSFKACGTLFINCSTPFLINSITFLPRLTQLSAVHTASTASKIFGILAISVGIAEMIPCMIVHINCTPPTSSFGALSLIAPAKLITICGTCSISIGSESIMPCTRLRINSMPTSTRFPAPSRNVSEKLSIMGKTCSRNAGMPSTSPSPILVIHSRPALRKLGPLSVKISVMYSTMASAASARSGPRSLNILGTSSIRIGASRLTATPIPESALPTAGTRFPAAVIAESTKSVINWPRFASGLARPATRFSHADFAAFNDPSMVDAASLAVVPAMPCFC